MRLPATCHAPVEPAVGFRIASRDDLLGIGRVYLRAFEQTLQHLRSPDLSAAAVADVVGACLLAEPESVIVAQAGPSGGIVGYIVGVADAGRVRRVSLARGLPLVWFWRWLSGRYRLPLRAAMGLLGDKVRFWEASRAPGASCPARIISVAVDPACQRAGIGSRLLETALARLRGLRCGCVRLEVRPDNQAARRLYERFGFRRVGEYRDTRGPWEIMVLEVHPASPGPGEPA